MRRTVGPLILSVLITAQLGWSQQGLDQQFGYQGVLKDNSGNLLNGTYNLTFQLFTDSLGVTPIGITPGGWSETHTVNVTNGLFSVILGRFKAFSSDTIYFDYPYWLEVSVGGQILSPRTKLVPAPYAIKSRGVIGGNTTITPSGRIGLGVTSPTRALQVLRYVGGDYVASIENTDNASGGEGLLVGVTDTITTGRSALMVQGNGDTLFAVSNQGDVKLKTMERWYAIPHHEFTPWSGSYTRDIYKTYHNSAGVNVNFSAPVHLPHGATITGFTAVVGDTVANNMQIEIVRQSNTGTVWSLVALNSTGPGEQTLNSSTISLQVVDNQSYTYLIRAGWEVPYWGMTYQPYSAYIRAVRIKYTVDRPLP